jgi:hypothetical protein
VILRHRWFRPGFGDAIIFPFLVVFARQYFWFLDNQISAWSLSFLCAALVWILFLRLQDHEERTPTQFWLVVAVPLFVVYAMRVALPDTSYDVLNYHLVGSERGLRGWPFIPGDFFPPFYPLNPAPDMLLGIFRHLFGYRLGTVFNFMVLLWSGTILTRILRPYVNNPWLRSIAVLMVLWTEQTLFLINTYMIDVLALPLLLEATRISLRPIEQKGQAARRLVQVALLVGMSVALKVLNLAYAIPILFVYLHTLLCHRRSLWWPKLLKFAPLAAAAVLFPLLPYSVYMCRQTGNPIFPMYNAIWKSVYWPAVNLYDGRWGAQTIAASLLWPLRIAFNSAGTGELLVYSGRVSLATIAAPICLLVAWRDYRLRALSFATLLASVLWSIMLTGYARYAIFVEMLGGIVVVGLLAQLLSRWKDLRLTPGLSILLLLLLVAGSIVQIGRTSKYVAQTEWSQRPLVFEDLARHKAEARFILRDYRLEAFFDETDRGQLADIGVWIESAPLTSGFQSLLKPDVPILCAYIPDYFHNAEGRERFDRALKQSPGNKLASLCLQDSLDACNRVLADRGLEIVERYPVTMFVYSKRTGLQMYLLTLRVPKW